MIEHLLYTLLEFINPPVNYEVKRIDKNKFLNVLGSLFVITIGFICNMFKSSIKNLFSAPKKINEPNYFYFEDNDVNKAAKQMKKEALAELQTLMELKQVDITSIEVIHQEAFYDFLFGRSSSKNQHDELSLYISNKIENFLSKPKNIFEALPVLPLSLTQVIKQLNDKEFDTKILIDMIHKDPIIATKVIELANSSHYNRSNKSITNLKSAFLLLGVNGLMEGVVNGFISKLIPQSQIYFRQYGNKIWKHCFTTGVISKDLINRSHYKQESGEGYFIGLICNLGEIIIYQLLMEAFSYVHPDYQPSSFAFKDLMFKNSKKITYHIAQYWNLPSSIIDVLALQEELTKSSMLPFIFSKQPIGCYIYEANMISKLELMLEHQEIDNDALSNIKSCLVFSDEAKQYLEKLFNREST